MAVFLTGCQQNSLDPSGEEQTSGSDTVNLTVWGAEEDEELLRQIIDGFETEYQGQADFQITYEPQSESHCTDALMADLENGADVFAFADDQLNTLVAAGALEPIENADTVRNSNLPEAVLAASVNDTLYALPLTADNGYFLYYNKAYFSEEDIKSLDQMLAIAAVVGEHIMLDKRTIRIEAIVVHTAHSGNFHLTARSRAAGQAFLHPLQQLVVLSQNGSQQQIVTFPD